MENDGIPLERILDLAVLVVKSKPPSPEVVELESAPRSIQEAARAISQATQRRIYELAEHQGWWLFSLSLPPTDPPGLRFHNGYGLKPGAQEVYSFGFW